MKKFLILGAALAALSMQSACVEAAQPAPAAEAERERLVALEGAQNFRDIGGYRTTDGRTVRWGLIYRSSELSHLTPGDIERLGGMDIESIHDLRSIDERTEDPTAWTGEGAPEIIAHDYEMDMSGFSALFEGEVTEERARATMTRFYPGTLDLQRPQQRALFADLIEGEGAIVYHCTAGKDRTGVATALILSALGVPRETILADYELSNRYYSGGIQETSDSEDPAMAAFMNLPPEVIQVFMGVDAAYLQAVFDRIDSEYGSVEAYLNQELDVDAADIARLRELYTV